MNRSKMWMTTFGLCAISVAAFAGTGNTTLAYQATPAAPAAPVVQGTPAVKPTPAPRPAQAGLMKMSGNSYMGVDIADVTSDRLSALKLNEERGVEITMVDQDAPAGKAGLKERDVILEFNGARIEGEEQLRRMLRETPAGRVVNLNISRDGQPMQVKVTLGSREKMVTSTKVWKVQPGTIVMPKIPDIDIPAIEMVVRSYSRKTGMMVDNLTPQLGEFFGVKSGKGVLVRSVEKGSAAESAGLKAGDVIVKVDDESIEDRNDWNRTLRKKGGKLNIGIVRDKREQSLTVTLPESRPEETGFNLFNTDWDTDFEMPDMESFNSTELEKGLFNLRRDLIKMEPKLLEQQTKMRAALDAERMALREKIDSAQIAGQEASEQLKMKMDRAREEVEKVRQKMTKFNRMI
ncbi:MAG TPA: PDZ domain-containing protein [Terriglobales bacterium]|nr:PDZ domain-containing protein [Terriglobales bacterium]